MLAGSPQSLWTVVPPEEDGAPPIAVVQVSQQGGDHLEGGGHSAQVLALRRGLLERHQSVGVDLERKNQSDDFPTFKVAMATAVGAGQEVLMGLQSSWRSCECEADV